MSEFNFKVGQSVYYPTKSNQILVIHNSEGFNYPLQVTYTDPIYNNVSHTTFTIEGLSTLNDVNSPIFPATQENYELLSKLYPNVEFEPPPKRKKSKEIVRTMLDSGYHGVPCKTECGCDRYICTGIVEDEFYAFQYDNDEDSAYSSGIPYHPKTGLKIIDFIDGKCVLENGEIVE